jgi:hypothetical protein
LLAHVAGYHLAGRYAVAYDLATSFQAVLDQERVVLRSQGVHGHGGLDAMAFQYIQQTKNAHSMTVLAMGKLGVLREVYAAQSARW